MPTPPAPTASAATPSLPSLPRPESGEASLPNAEEDTKSNVKSEGPKSNINEEPAAGTVQNSVSPNEEASRSVAAARSLSKASRESVDSRPDADMMEFVNEVSEALNKAEEASPGDGTLHESLDIFSEAIEDDLG